jgi:hypothetical protein
MTISMAPRSLRRRADQRAASHRPRDREHQARLQRRGAAGIACLELLRAIGFKPDNLILATPRA